MLKGLEFSSTVIKGLCKCYFQVTTIEESSEEEDVKERKKAHDKPGKTGTDAKSSRSDSLKRREGKDDIKSSKNVKRDNKVITEDGGDLKRSASVKVKGEKAKAAAEPNLKSSDVNKGKDKGIAAVFYFIFVTHSCVLIYISGIVIA